MNGLAMRSLRLVIGSALLVILAPGSALAQEITGRWDLHGRDGEDQVQLNMRVSSDRGNWQNGRSIDLDELQGLSQRDIDNDAQNVSFQLVRDAGTIRFEGDFRRGEGTGFFSFTVNQDYVRTMSGLGYPGLSDERVYQFALQQVSVEFVQELHRLGYRSDSLSENQLWQFAIHGVRPAYIRAMNDLGYESIAPKDLIQMRIHGVSPDYVREIRAALQ